MTKLAHPTLGLLKVDVASSTEIYVGEASFTSSTSLPVWRIYKVQIIGPITDILWADGDPEYDNIWDNRTSLSYS